VQLEGEKHDRILQSLYGVGPKKNIGYLPLYTVSDLLQIDLDQVVEHVTLRGLSVVIFNVDQCCIKSGAIYVYDRDELENRLEATNSLLIQHGLSVDPDIFVKQIALTWFEPEHPVYPVVAAAFGETCE
jgi:hypothetical protein